MNILQLVNKIKWDRREDPEDYTLIYIDRISKQEKQLEYVDVLKLEGNFLLLKTGTHIPLHRIRKVLKHGKIIWQR